MVDCDIVNQQFFQWSLALVLSKEVWGTQQRLKTRCPQLLLLSSFVSQLSTDSSVTVHHLPRRGPAGPRPLLLLYGASYLSRSADFEQVEPVGVPVVDDVGQFPPLLLPAPRHGGQPSERSPSSCVVKQNFP